MKLSKSHTKSLQVKMPIDTIQHIATVFPIDPEVLKSDRKIRRSGSILKEFALNTSTNGIPGIARSQSVHNRIFWSISTLIFTGIMTYFVVESILQYFQYPTQTSLSIVVEWPQAFPAVTICNYSPIRYDPFIGPFLNYTNARNLTNTTDTTKFTVTQASYVDDFLLYKLNRGESLNDFFYPLESMMMSCSYNGMSCTATNFTWFLSPSYGLCYTFNAKLKNESAGSIKYNADNGGIGSLLLGLYVHQNQSVPYLSSASGMVALVHDNAEIPIIELAAMQLGPGRHNKLSYTKTTNLFLPSPYTTCNDQVNLGMQVIYDQYYGTDYGYSIYQCYAACIQAYTYQTCSCGNPFRWAARSVVLPGNDTPINITLCDIGNPCYTIAGTKIMNTPSIWNTYCPDCTIECSSVDFAIKSTSLSAPSTFLLNDIKQFVESSNIRLPENWLTSWISYIQTNYLELEVSYETTRSQIYSQQATLGPVDVLSNVGGQSGLWIGISFLTLLEIVEMIYRLTRTQGYNLWGVMRNKFRAQDTAL